MPRERLGKVHRPAAPVAAVANLIAATEHAAQIGSLTE
jgi:hypothetical protein